MRRRWMDNFEITVDLLYRSFNIGLLTHFGQILWLSEPYFRPWNNFFSTVGQADRQRSSLGRSTQNITGHQKKKNDTYRDISG